MQPEQCTAKHNDPELTAFHNGMQEAEQHDAHDVTTPPFPF